MGDRTTIEWTRGDDGTPGATWNPVTGCTEVSPGCDHCYAKTFAERWRGTPGHYFEHGFDVQLRPDKLELPLRWRRPRRIFVNSMSDLFHDQVPDDYIVDVFAVMAANYCRDQPTHTFQVLTKRHARMRSLLSSDEFRVQVARTVAGRTDDEHADTVYDAIYHHYWPLPNVWLGVSTENQQWADMRIPALLDTPAAVRWISAEPLLGPIDLRRAFAKWTPANNHPAWRNARRGAEIKVRKVFHWVVVGGESGRGARPMHPDWARSLRDQCQAAEVAFLYKQNGEWLGMLSDEHRGLAQPQTYVNVVTGEVADETEAIAEGGDWAGVWRVGKKAAGRLLDGQTWNQYPRPTETPA